MILVSNLTFMISRCGDVTIFILNLESLGFYLTVSVSNLTQMDKNCQIPELPGDNEYLVLRPHGTPSVNLNLLQQQPPWSTAAQQQTCKPFWRDILRKEKSQCKESQQIRQDPL